MINIAVLGYGTVGSGVVELIDKNKNIFTKKAGDEINVKYILDLRKFPGDKNEDKFTNTFDTILNDNEITTVVETIGGLTFAYEYTKKALQSGRSVVTSNKELVAEKAPELLKLAKENNVKYMFEASVGGGIPIIRPLIHCLSANELHKIEGILNGTTNYILTKMIKENMTMEEALKQAQEHGYAEKDPTSDIDGHDTCRKICILAALSFGKHIYPENVYTKGIRDLTLKDIKAAEDKGYVIKLLGCAKKDENNKVEIFVSPCAIKKDHPLANIEDVFNGITVSGDAVGDVTFYGRGAGKFPTASAICADVIDTVNKHDTPEILWTDGSNDIVKPFKLSDFELLDGTDIPVIE